MGLQHIVTNPVFADAFWMVRELTGDRRFDPFLLETGRPYVRYRLTVDKNLLVEDIEQTVNQPMRQRWPHMTSEGVLTDRIGYTPRTVSYMTGALPEMSFQGFPHHAVTYTGTGRDFAAVVEAATAEGAAGALLLVRRSSPAGRLASVEARTRRALSRDGRAGNAGAGTGRAWRADLGDDSAAPGSRGAHRADFRPRLRLLPAPISGLPLTTLAGTRRPIRSKLPFTTWARPMHTIFRWPSIAVEELLERAVITRIGAPLDLQRETITVGTWRHRDTMTEGDVVTVVVDPDGKIPEITRSQQPRVLAAGAQRRGSRADRDPPPHHVRSPRQPRRRAACGRSAR